MSKRKCIRLIESAHTDVELLKSKPVRIYDVTLPHFFAIADLAPIAKFHTVVHICNEDDLSIKRGFETYEIRSISEAWLALIADCELAGE